MKGKLLVFIFLLIALLIFFWAICVIIFHVSSSKDEKSDFNIFYSNGEKKIINEMVVFQDAQSKAFFNHHGLHVHKMYNKLYLLDVSLNYKELDSEYPYAIVYFTIKVNDTVVSNKKYGTDTMSRVRDTLFLKLGKNDKLTFHIRNVADNDLVMLKNSYIILNSIDDHKSPKDIVKSLMSGG